MIQKLLKALFSNPFGSNTSLRSTPLPTVQLVRMKRIDHKKWDAAKSWLGGLPTIDPDKWPRNAESGLPLHHLAQIDLAEVPNALENLNLPGAGTLNFFADTELEVDDIAAAVIYTPVGQDWAEASPPSDCPPLHGANWSYDLKGAPDKERASRVFRRWPVELVLFRTADKCLEVGPEPSSLHVFANPDYVQFSAKKLVDRILPRYMPWRALDEFGEHLKLVQMAFPESYGENVGSIDQLVEKLRSMAAGKDPFSFVNEDNEEALSKVSQLRELTNKDVSGGGYVDPMRDAVLSVFRKFDVADSQVRELMPDFVSEFLRWEKVNAISPAQYPWETVTRLMNSYTQSLNGYRYRELSESELQPARQFIANWLKIASGYDPYDPIGSEVTELENDMERIRQESDLSPQYGGGTSALRDAASEVYRDMMVGPRDVHAKIPELIRTYFDEFRQRSAWGIADKAHTMFGQFDMVQSSADLFADETPMLQLQSDDMMSWCWGDVGSIAIGMPTKALKKRKWNTVWGLFEGH